MQTFLPLEDIEESIKCLDLKRLGKQRLEARSILDILQGKFKSEQYKDHPAVLMWEGYEDALKLYYNFSLLEWIGRGYMNTLPIEKIKSVELPKFIGNEEFHASHRSNLLRKNPDWYKQFGWIEPDNLPYYWPKRKEQ